jgi:predicted Holliday junction resolvase-like endonuclease
LHLGRSEGSELDSNGLFKNLVAFFKAARHLWGRCPSCGTAFRLSDAAISSSPNPPRDWLRRLEKEQVALVEQQGIVEAHELELEERETELREFERGLLDKERYLERNAHERVQQILRSNTEVQVLIRAANKAAVQRSRATLIGRLLERMAPCFRTFAHDPRDMRCICDPVDYVLFDGLTVDREVRQVTFIEVKSGRSRLTKVQRSVREAVEKGRVCTEVWEIGDSDIPITKQLPPALRHTLSE